MQKEAQVLETKKQVMAFKLQIKSQNKEEEKAKLLEKRRQKKQANEEEQFDLTDDEEDYIQEQRPGQGFFDERQQYNNQDLGMMSTQFGNVNRFQQ